MKRMEEKLKEVDVIMCTWNSNKPYFNRCLKSIKREVPVHHFIVVDRYSTDNTFETIKKYFHEPSLKIIQTKENLAKARKIGISHVDTEFFVFLDDDIELPKNWFHRLTSKINKKVGAIHQLDEHIMINNPIYDRWIRWKISWRGLWKKIPIGTITDVTEKEINQFRGYTHSTIIRTQLVKDWNPDALLSAFEDWMIMKHIVKKGFVWRILNIYDIKHYSSDTMLEFLRKTRWAGAGTRVTNFAQLTLTKILWIAVKQNLKAFLASFQTRQPLMMVYEALMRFYYLDGYLRWNKFVVMVRK